jgi:signal transduction histidine kinase
MLERVRGAGDRLKRLLDEFDHAIWLHADPRRQLCIGDCDPVTLVQDLAARLDPAAAARSVRLLVDSELREGEVKLSADAELLLTALDYVAGLAVLRSRGTAVRVRLARGARGAEGAPTVTITDEAGVLPPDVLDRLFEPFVERSALPLDMPPGAGPGAAPTPRRKERLGLGLAVARGILEAHSGGLSASLVLPGPDGAAPPGPAGGLRFICTLGSAPGPAQGEEQGPAR